MPFYGELIIVFGKSAEMTCSNSLDVKRRIEPPVILSQLIKIFKTVINDLMFEKNET